MGGQAASPLQVLQGEKDLGALQNHWKGWRRDNQKLPFEHLVLRSHSYQPHRDQETTSTTTSATETTGVISTPLQTGTRHYSMESICCQLSPLLGPT